MPSHGQLEPPFGHGEPLFPTANGFYSGNSNPALSYKDAAPRSSIRIHDRFLLPELALQEWRLALPTENGTWQAQGVHYGNQLFRKARLELGYSLLLGEEFHGGLRVGPSWVRIGQGYGQRLSWNARLGISASFSENWRWAFWVRDPHSALLDPDETPLLRPSASIAFGRKWRDANAWSVRVRKVLDRPLSIQSRGRIQLHERFKLITGLYAPPLSPLLGWSYLGEKFLISLISGWTPVLGPTPECSLHYRFGE